MYNPLDKYKLSVELGKGMFGVVNKTFNTEKGKTVALKEVNIPNNAVKKTVDIEVDLLKKISEPSCNPFVTCFYDSFYYDGKLFIEMEYIDGKSLKEFSQEYRQKKELNQLYKHLSALSEDVLKGLQYLHGKKIIHRDIKPENIMIDKNNVPKIIDIGLGCLVTKVCAVKREGTVIGKECCYGFQGSPIFMAPEIMLTNQSYFVSDIWSLGATLFNEAIDDYLYNVNNINELRFQLKNKPAPRLKTPNMELNKIVNSMLVKDPLFRPTSSQLLDKLFNFKNLFLDKKEIPNYTMTNDELFMMKNLSSWYN